MRTRVAASDFNPSSKLLLAIEYHFKDNQVVQVNNLTGDEARTAGPLPLTLLATVMEVGEMVLVRTQT